MITPTTQAAAATAPNAYLQGPEQNVRGVNLIPEARDALDVEAERHSAAVGRRQNVLQILHLTRTWV